MSLGTKLGCQWLVCYDSGDPPHVPPHFTNLSLTGLPKTQNITTTLKTVFCSYFLSNKTVGFQIGKNKVQHNFYLFINQWKLCEYKRYLWHVRKFLLTKNLYNIAQQENISFICYFHHCKDFITFFFFLSICWLLTFSPPKEIPLQYMSLAINAFLSKQTDLLHYSLSH